MVIPQRDGSIFSMPRDDALAAVFDHWAASIEAEYHGTRRPPAPPVLKAVADAQDPARALDQVLGDYHHILAFEREALERGELVER